MTQCLHITGATLEEQSIESAQTYNIGAGALGMLEEMLQDAGADT